MTTTENANCVTGMQKLLGLFLTSTMLAGTVARAATMDELFAMPVEELAKAKASIATGTPKKLIESPAATTVITAADLKIMGARTLDEALETVPGLHVSRGSFLYAPRYFIRGIVSTYNPQTLLLVNGIPQTGLFVGDRGERISNRYSLPVEAIQRIEVIRGPGSALYGADAFAGVINVITKGPDDLHGAALTTAVGSFKTGSAALQDAGNIGPVRALFGLTYYQTAGDHGAIITSDAQTNIDSLNMAPPASLAPGPVQTSTSDYDARMVLSWDKLRLRTSWMRAWNVGTGQGINEALDPVGRFNVERGNADLTWHDPELGRYWDVEAQISYLYSTYDNPSGIMLYPPGAFFGTFPQGVISHPGLEEYSTRMGVTALYSGWDRHAVRLGTGISRDDIFDVDDNRNWMLSSGPVPVVPRPGGFQDISDTPEIFEPEAKRRSQYVFAQDEWALARHWEMTAGLRYDHFSDVGDTTNPRIALVWTTTPQLTSKLLYGEAFRPPAFFELYATSNPVALGNSHLKPEKIKNSELAFNWRPTPAWAVDVNLYSFRITDYIDFVNDPGALTYTARNASRINGHGIETEVRHQFSSELQVLGNYSHQDTKDESTGSPLGLAPTEQAYLRAVWGFAPRWQLTPQIEWVGERKRAAGDVRPALQGYTAFGFALRKTWPHDIELALITRNLFDADVREPSRGPNSGQTVPTIANDLPQQGRSVTLEAVAHW